LAGLHRLHLLLLLVLLVLLVLLLLLLLLHRLASVLRPCSLGCSVAWSHDLSSWCPLRHRALLEVLTTAPVA
jgi:hypothetical protein